MSKKLFVGNLPFTTTEEEVRNLLEEYGEVTDIAFIRDRETKRFRGFCFVEMDDDGARAAITSLNGQEYNGRPLKVNEAQERENRGGSRGGGNFGGGKPGGRPGGRPGGGKPRSDAMGGNRRNFPSGSGHR